MRKKSVFITLEGTDGVGKTTHLALLKNWLKKKLTTPFKTQAQREIDAQPQYPTDLDQMRDTLDQTIQQLQTDPPQVDPNSPEMRAAEKAYRKHLPAS